MLRDRTFPGRAPAVTMPAMHESPATGNLTAPPASAGIRRAADLRLRGRGGPIGVRVRWPASQALGSPPPVVVVLADPSGASAAGPADDALCDELCAGLGALVLRASWATRRDDAPDSALERAAGSARVGGRPRRRARRRPGAADRRRAGQGRRRGRRPGAAGPRPGLAAPRGAGAGAHPARAPPRRAPRRRPRRPRPRPRRRSSPRSAGSRCSQRLRAEGAEVNELVDARVDPREFPQQPYLPGLTESLRGSLA